MKHLDEVGQHAGAKESARISARRTGGEHQNEGWFWHTGAREGGIGRAAAAERLGERGDQEAAALHTGTAPGGPSGHVHVFKFMSRCERKRAAV